MISSLINRAKFISGFWGTHVFIAPGTTGDSLGAGIWDRTFQFHSELNIEQSESTEAQNPLMQRGGDRPKEFSISVQVLKQATGQAPLSVYKSWMKSLGKKHPFFIGMLPINSSRYILRGVELHFVNQDIHPSGEPYHATITLHFSEDTLLEVPNQDVEEEETKDGKKKKSAKKVGAKKGEKDRVWNEENVRKAKKRLAAAEAARAAKP